MGARGLIEFIAAYIKLNLQAAMEYRFSFVVQTFGMLLNDVVWIVFWIIIFSKFHTIGGWTINSIYLMYAVVTVSFGLLTFFAGNWSRIAEMIIKGQLDYYLALPKPVLPHLLISRSRLSGMGDIIFGVAVGIISIPHSIPMVLLYLLLMVLSGTVLLSFAIIMGSLGFFIGGMGDLQDTIIGSLVAFSTYPFSVFGGVTKLLLLTVLPVGLLAGIPVSLLQNFNPILLLYMVAGAAIFFVAANVVFKIGLRRYESGNLINVQI